MSDKTILQLPSASSLSGSEALPIVQSNDTVQTTVQSVANLAISATNISGLTSATTPLAGTELVSIIQGGNTRKTTAQDIANLGGGGGGVTASLQLDRNSTSNQNPGGTDTALQVSFGGFYSTVAVSLSPGGTLTFNTAGTYIINVFFNASRVSGSAGASFLMFRTLFNGSAIFNTKALFLNTVNQSTPYESTFVIQASSTNTLQFEIMRNSSGLNDGGLYAYSASGSWANIPSASLKVWKID